jgi:hypothetical protein
MTYLTSGMVIELSAILVATITFLLPSSFAAVLKALSYSSLKNYYHYKCYLLAERGMERDQLKFFPHPFLIVTLLNKFDELKYFM